MTLVSMAQRTKNLHIIFQNMESILVSLNYLFILKSSHMMYILDLRVIGDVIN